MDSCSCSQLHLCPIQNHQLIFPHTYHWIEPMQTHGWHANFTQKGPSLDSNPGLSWCETAMPTTVPPCHPIKKFHTIIPQHYYVIFVHIYLNTPKWQKGVTHLHLRLVTAASVYCSLLTSTSVFNCSSEVLVLHLKFLLLHNATALFYILEGNAFLKMLNFLETQNYFIKYNKNTSVVKKKKRRRIWAISRSHWMHMFDTV